MIEPDAHPGFRGGTGEPLVLIHGGAGTWRLWKPCIPLLTPHHDVLAVTLAGHFGGPELPPGTEPTVDALADAVERDMDAAGFETAHVAGGSLGGWVALELARRGRARSVVAIAPGGGWERGTWGLRRVLWMYRILTVGAKLPARNPRPWSTRPRLRRLLTWHHFAHAERIPPADFAYLLAGAAGVPVLGEAMRWVRGYGGARGLEDIPARSSSPFPRRTSSSRASATASGWCARSRASRRSTCPRWATPRWSTTRSSSRGRSWISRRVTPPSRESPPRPERRLYLA